MYVSVQTAFMTLKHLYFGQRTLILGLAKMSGNCNNSNQIAAMRPEDQGDVEPAESAWRRGTGGGSQAL